MIPVLTLAVLLASLLPTRTIVRPDQIKDWSQVSPTSICPAVVLKGTTIALSQAAIDQKVVDGWKMVCRDWYDHYRVAVRAGEPNPILITCPQPVTAPHGPGCDSRWPVWFTGRCYP